MAGGDRVWHAVPTALAVLLAAPVAVGLAGAVLPAFGYLPALGGDGFTLQPFRDLFAVPGIWRSAALSLVTGLATTAVSLLATLLFVAAFSGTRAFRAARQGLGPLLAVPHAAAAFGLAFLIAPSGLLLRLVAGPLGLEAPPDLLIVNDPLGLAMMAGLVAKELPFLLLVVFAALPQADAARRLDLARSLGYGRIAGFTLAVWPAVYRQIRLPVLAVAAFASSVVDVAMILGPATPPVLAVRLVGWMNDPDLSLRFQASAGALLQCGVTLLVLLLWLALERTAGALSQGVAARGTRMRRDGIGRALALVPVALAGIATVLGLAALALWSVAGAWRFPDLLPASYASRAWTAAASDAAGPLATTAIAALGSSLLALLLVVLLLEARRRAAPVGVKPRLSSVVAGLLYLPLIVPQVAFVFGLQIVVFVADLAPSMPLLVAVHLVFVAPYVALALADPWFSLDPRYERMAASLGHLPGWTFLAVRLPLMVAPLLTALAIGVAVSVGQYLPTVLIGAGRLTTITTEAVALSSGGNRRIVGVYALLQTLLPALVFAAATLVPALIHRHRRGMRA